MLAVVFVSLAQVVEQTTFDPPSKQPTGLVVPFLVIVAVIALIVAIAALLRARRADE